MRMNIPTRRKTLLLPVLAGALLAPPAALAAPKVGAPAPAFSGIDSHGKTHSLGDYKGKYVVLEWLNHGCPYVAKHYGSGNMQKLQREWTDKGAVWLSVQSSAKGKQGNQSAEEANKTAKEKGSAASAILLDEGGDIARAYGAQTTPHMFVIDPKGKLIYAGAIDDKASTDEEDVAGATNYVSAALTAAMAGKPVKVASTKAYGCSVKY